MIMKVLNSDPWNPQPKFSADFDKIKCLEFTLLPGKTLYIPAYWWYSIKCNDNTSISCFNYRTYINNLAVLPYICLHALQIQNVKRDVVKKANIHELNHTEIVQSNNVEIVHPIDQEESQNNYHLDNQHVNQDENSTKIDDLPQPASIDNNFGTDIN